MIEQESEVRICRLLEMTRDRELAPKAYHEPNCKSLNSASWTKGYENGRGLICAGTEDKSIHIHRAAGSAGIGRVGWTTMRHSCRAWLPFVHTYRTLCIAPKPETKLLLVHIRDFVLEGLLPWDDAKLMQISSESERSEPHGAKSGD